ncbi:MAG: adenylate/guanylate cyclase domain-containing protein [Solirubrobacterales bacterium]|nr:adenylate/guanylate cyclase domain-containing protein [Solirubrobacterales bacterium]
MNDDELLAGLEGDDRRERTQLIAYLREEHGATDEELARSHAEGTLMLVAAGRNLGAAERYSAADVARETGLPAELWAALSRANGLPVPVDDDVVHYGEVDLEAARTAKQFLDAGIPRDQLLNTSRVLSRGLAPAAELMRQTAMGLALSPGLTERELAETYAQVTRGLVPMVGPLVDQLLRIHLAHAVREEVVTAAEREAGSLPGAREVSVAFADLVGFTRLGAQLPPDQLEHVAERLTQITTDLIEPPVRFVKAIGDAVLLVCPDPTLLVGVSQRLVAAAEAEGEDYPQLRVGVASGAAVTRAGDWFGTPVNLASRITTVARAGSVVADHATRKAIGDTDGYAWSFIGEKKLKGIPGTVKLHRARPADRS